MFSKWLRFLLTIIRTGPILLVFWALGFWTIHQRQRNQPDWVECKASLHAQRYVLKHKILCIFLKLKKEDKKGGKNCRAPIPYINFSAWIRCSAKMWRHYNVLESELQKGVKVAVWKRRLPPSEAPGWDWVNQLYLDNVRMCPFANHTIGLWNQQGITSDSGFFGFSKFQIRDENLRSQQGR